MAKEQPRKLAVILGDQLDLTYPEALQLDPGRDVIVMVEVAEASRSPASSVIRTAAFLSAMRHHAASLRKAGWTVEYVRLGDDGNTQSFEGEFLRAIERLAPDTVVVIEPGSFAVDRAVRSACVEAGVDLETKPDPHFLCSTSDFAEWASGRKSLTMEYFYRMMRKRLDVLMDEGKPVGGAWNFDKENRRAFKAAPTPPPVPEFPPDEITRGVLDAIKQYLPDLPGRSGTWIWPVTRDQALESLHDFVDHRLAFFGDYQDAMWTGGVTLYHSVISVPLNLKLLNPREVVAAAVEAYQAGRAPINAVEGFVRQIIGWREFIRGVYFFEGAGYEQRNGLDHHGSLPDFYWTGETDMRCMHESIEGVLDLGYAHHISRLMVTGNFAMIAGIDPRLVNDWYLGMYADGVEWVTTPNTIGMAMHADGGVVGTKPYAASGKYIQRMSNYCKHCPHDVKRRSGEGACPFNVFYWDFLIRNESRFRPNARMKMVLKNLDRIADEERVEITVSARSLREQMGIGDVSNPPAR